MIPRYDSPPYADYRTPPDQIRKRWFPSTVFYVHVIRTVLFSSFRARFCTYGDLEWYNSSYAVRRAVEAAGGTLRIQGTANMAAVDGPFLVIGNHMSTAETFLLETMILPFNRVTFVVKRSLVEYPVFKHVMRSCNPVVVGRLSPREDLKTVLEDGMQRLNSGISLVVFPQKTRTVEFSRDNFNTIGVKLAKRAGVPIIPLALKTNGWGNGVWFKDYGTFRPELPFEFAFGPAIHVTGSDRDAHDAVLAFIEQKLTEWA